MSDQEPEVGLASSRSRRSVAKRGASGRESALEQLRQAKQSGKKVKYEVAEIENVYDEVPENEYSSRVRARQEDDFIVGDDCQGYVEDGREIFDEDLDDEKDAYGSKNKNHVGKTKKKKSFVENKTSRSTNIESMFKNMTGTKKKLESDMSIEGDDVLGDILAELKSQKTISPKPTAVLKKKPKRPPPKSEPSDTHVNPFATRPSSHILTTETTNNSQRQSASPRVPTSSQSAAPDVATAPADNPDSGVHFSDELDAMDVDDFDGVDFGESFTPDDDQTQPETMKASENAAETTLNSQSSQLTQNQTKHGNIILGSYGKAKTWADIQEVSEIPDIADSQSVPEPTDITVDSTSLPLVVDDNGERVFRFFWFDAYEDQYKQPGTVYLFGKVRMEKEKVWVSCCVTVRNIERQVYLLPRENKMNLKTGVEGEEEISMKDVYQEFNDSVATRHKIMKFKSMRVEKNYAFEIADIPYSSEYLEVRYSADLPPLPPDLKGETFSHAFGTRSSSLELLLLNCDINGPCWLDVHYPQIQSPAVSWCKIDAHTVKPDHVRVSADNGPPPPTVVMSLVVRTIVNPKTHQNEVVAVCASAHQDFHIDRAPPKKPYQSHFCAMSKPQDAVYPYDIRQALGRTNMTKVEILSNERTLLNYLLAKVHRIDPDIIVGHDILSFDLDVLLHRINTCKTPHWSKIGRLKRSYMPRSSGHGRGFSVDASVACGRLVCDVKISAKELIRVRSYDLSELSSHLLKCQRHHVDADMVRGAYGESKDLLSMIQHLWVDSVLILRLLCELNVLPLALQITNIAGNVMSRTLCGGRAERNEFLLLHAFHNKNFIVPDKETRRANKQVIRKQDNDENDDECVKTSSGKRKKPAYSGGLVLEPKRGFYDKYILLLDFNSLYPSIIQEYNICFTTVQRGSTQSANDDDMVLPELPEKTLEDGILPTEIRKLVERRRQVKRLMKGNDLTQDQLLQYDIRQKALKLTANSMYGCLGFTNSRFYAKPLAALITSKGREILLKTKEMVEALNLEVIYGDTDSIMINTNTNDLDSVYKIGNKVKSEVNKLYRLLEIDIDGVYQSMLLLKKKKYAALAVVHKPTGIETTKEMKGLDIVRRDWSDIAKSVGDFVLDEILSCKSREQIVENIHEHLCTVAQNVSEGKLELSVYEIRKSLTKNPEDYPDKKSLPHVQVALRLNSKGGKRMKNGDTVTYVICQDGSNLPYTQRAYHPEEVLKADNLIIDDKYYLAHQIHPVVSRLCEPIAGTSPAQIADCLGLDTSSYRNVTVTAGADDEDEGLDGTAARLAPEERFKECGAFVVKCPDQNCGFENTIDKAYTVDDHGSLILPLAKCQNSACKVVLYKEPCIEYVRNKLILEMRGYILKYYQGWLRCDDVGCGNRTRRLPAMFQRKGPQCVVCYRGHLYPEYPDSSLYNQLNYLLFLFDVDKMRDIMSENEKFQLNQTVNTSQELREAYTLLFETVNIRLKQNAYSTVHLSGLFKNLFPTSNQE